MGRFMRRVLGSTLSVLVLGALLGGCAVDIDNAPINVPLSATTPPLPPVPSQKADETTAVGVAFSGGGTRAAAFSFGVLKQFAQTPVPPQAGGPTLLDHVEFISGVSGGSITAAYFGYRGQPALDDFRDKFLIQNLEGSLLTKVTPDNFMRALAGGVNDRRGVQTWLDAHLFHGATFASLGGGDKPSVWVNASDIYNGTPFVFDQQTFDALCSDLSKLPISEAVAASAAVPIAFAPIVIQSFPDSCHYTLPPWAASALTGPSAPANLQAFAKALQNYHDPAVMKYVKLLDGGLIDNYGLSGLVLRREQASTPYGPFSPGQAVKLRRLLFVVVDAGQSIDAHWVDTVKGPSGVALIMAATDTALDAGKRASFDLFSATMEEWHQSLVNYRCGLPRSEVQRLRGTLDGWDCKDMQFYIARLTFGMLPPQEAATLSQLPTTLALPANQIDALIAGGGEALTRSAEFQQFLRSVGEPVPQVESVKTVGVEAPLR
jgi:NTE family protein